MRQTEGNKSTLQEYWSKGLPVKFPAATIPSFLNLRRECPGEPGFGFQLYFSCLDLELMDFPPLSPMSCYLGQLRALMSPPQKHSGFNLFLSATERPCPPQKQKIKSNLLFLTRFLPDVQYQTPRAFNRCPNYSESYFPVFPQSFPQKGHLKSQET